MMPASLSDAARDALLRRMWKILDVPSLKRAQVMFDRICAPAGLSVLKTLKGTPTKRQAVVACATVLGTLCDFLSDEDFDVVLEIARNYRAACTAIAHRR